MSVALSPSASPILTMTRARLFAGLAVIGFANGVIPQVISALSGNALWPAIASGLGINWVVCLAFAVGLNLAVRRSSSSVTRHDLFVAAAFLLAILYPAPETSWLALSFLSAYLVITEKSCVTLRASAMIFFAITVCMIWGRLAVKIFAPYVEYVDAHVAGWIANVPVRGNLVPFASGDGRMIIGAGCSSLVNATFAFLLWISLTRYFRPVPKPGELSAILGVAAIVFLANTARIALMGQSATLFRIVHDGVGAPITSAIILFLTAAIALFGVRREIA